MTSTSFQSPHHGCHEPFRSLHDGDPVRSAGALASPDLQMSPALYAAQARRMKAFAGQRKFQAPVADDFSRGMLAAGQASNDGTKSIKLPGLFEGLAAWWRRRLG